MEDRLEHRSKRLIQEQLHQEHLHLEQRHREQRQQKQMSLFPAVPREAGAADAGRSARSPRARKVTVEVKVNPHLLAARRIAKKMRRLPDRDAETRAGLAICAQLKAYLADAEEPETSGRPPCH